MRAKVLIVLDQAVSSLGNFAFVAASAAFGTVRDVAVVSTLLLGSRLSVALGRGMLFEPFLHSVSPTMPLSRGRCIRTLAQSGAGGGLVMAGAVLIASLNSAPVAAGVIASGILVSVTEMLRTISIAHGEIRALLLADLIWTLSVVGIGIIAAIGALGASGPAIQVLIGSWALGGALGAIVLYTRLPQKGVEAAALVPLGRKRSGLEAASERSMQQVVWLSSARIMSPVDYSAVFASRSLQGIVNPLSLSACNMLIGTVDSPAAIVRSVRVGGVAILLGSAAWTAAVALTPVGPALLGVVWETAETFLAWSAAAIAVAGTNSLLVVGQRKLGLAAGGMSMQRMISPAAIGGATLFAASRGAHLAVMVNAIGWMVFGVTYYLQFEISARSSLRAEESV